MRLFEILVAIAVLVSSVLYIINTIQNWKGGKKNDVGDSAAGLSRSWRH
jgi:hypothetical protein